MCMAKQRQPLTLSGTGGEEGHRGGKLVTVTEALHQSPTVLCLQTTPGRGTKEKEGRGGEGRRGRKGGEEKRRKRGERRKRERGGAQREGEGQEMEEWRKREEGKEREEERGKAASFYCIDQITLTRIMTVSGHNTPADTGVTESVKPTALYSIRLLCFVTHY